MAQSLADWLTEHVEPLKDQHPAWLTGHYFHRDPVRACYSDSGLVMSPADGTVVHCDLVRPDSHTDVKGGTFTVADLLDGQAAADSYLAIGIFLSFYDVHVLRAPISGWVTHRRTEPIRTTNVSMIDAEDALLQGAFSGDDYYANERVISTFRSKRQTVHVVQIADEEVDHVLPFSSTPTSYHQGQRFSTIRFGSHAEVLIELPNGLIPAGIHKPLTHVEAGIDAIARWS